MGWHVLPSMAEAEAPPPQTLEVHLESAQIFKEAANVMAAMYQDVSLTFQKKSLRAQMRMVASSPGSAVMACMMNDAAFTKYECDEQVCLGLQTKALRSVMKLAEPNDSLLITHTSEDPYNARLEILSESGLRSAEFKLKLVWRSEKPTVTDNVAAAFMRGAENRKAIAKFPSAEFLKICNYLSEFGTSLKFNIAEEKITFTLESTARHTEGVGRVTLYPREGSYPVDLSVQETVTAAFDLGVLAKLATAASPLFVSIELGLSPDTPLLLKYPFQDTENGHLSFFLARRMSEDSMDVDC